MIDKDKELLQDVDTSLKEAMYAVERIVNLDYNLTEDYHFRSNLNGVILHARLCRDAIKEYDYGKVKEEQDKTGE